MFACLTRTSVHTSHSVRVWVRGVSSKYIRPHPRPYKRRWFEAAVAPAMPPSRRTCPSMLERKQKYEQHKHEYSDIELALKDLVREWMKREQFRMMAVCQFLPVNARTLWLTRNQLRLKGIELRSYGNRIMKKAFEETPLETLSVLLVGSNCTLFGKDLDSLRTVVTECDKLPWIVPLAVTFDSRVLSMDQVRALCSKRTFEEHRAETVAILTSTCQETVSLTDQHLHQLTHILDALSSHDTPIVT